MDVKLKGVEAVCGTLRSDIEAMKHRISDLYELPNLAESAPDMNLEGANIPKSRNQNVLANLFGVFRHMEGARMQLGKVMQAIQGGISILDK